jgi:hypothetical protein
MSNKSENKKNFPRIIKLKPPNTIQNNQNTTPGIVDNVISGASFGVGSSIGHTIGNNISNIFNNLNNHSQPLNNNACKELFESLKKCKDTSDDCIKIEELIKKLECKL